MIVLFLLIASRIWAESILRFFCETVQRSEWIFALDFVIAGWVFCAFLFLAFTHFSARKRDEEIRVVSRDFEDEVRPLVEAAAPAPAASVRETSHASTAVRRPPQMKGMVRWYSIITAVILLILAGFPPSDYED